MIILDCGRFHLVFIKPYIVAYIIDTKWDCGLVYVAYVQGQLVRVGDPFSFDHSRQEPYGVVYASFDL